MTAALILFAVCVAVIAAAINSLLWRRFAASTTGPWERAAAMAVLWFAVAIALSWLLSWARLLARWPLIAVAVVLALPAAVYLYRAPAMGRARMRASTAALLAPVALFVAFSLWRGAVVPVLSHDALSYHLPKAVMMARAHQYDFFEAPDPRIATSPPNYELLLADVILLTGSDRITEWVGTAAFVTLLLLGAALVERWWGDGAHVAVTVILSSAVPVILLHSGAHKNDLLANVFYTAALLWGGRWLAAQETAPLLLCLASLAAGCGTKVQGVFAVAALAAVSTWLLYKKRLRLTRRQVSIIIAAVPIGFLLFGGWAYAENIVHTSELVMPASSTSDAGYGDWSNVLEVPLLVLLRPFDFDQTSVYVPWRGERWFWPHFELYFSDFGMLVSILAVLLPLGVRRYGGQGERAYASIAASITFLLMLPIRIRPLGFFGGFPRYFAFIAIFVLAWTAAPLLRELWQRQRIVLARAFSVTSVLLLLVIGADYVLNDSFQPLDYVAHVARHPETRLPYFAGFRAGSAADAMAGPADTIAVHSGFDSWIYPLYGATLQRKVLFVQPGQPIPAEADYVVVDRAWNTIWGHPRFEHMGQYRQYLGRGVSTEEDVAVIRKLLADRERYEPVFFIEDRNQAVFKRRAEAKAAE